MTPVFIGGTGRSGTTIVRRALGRHSAVASLPIEVRVIVDPGGVVDLFRSLTDQWSPWNADHGVRTFETMMRRAAHVSALRKAENLYLPRLFALSPRRYVTLGFDRFFGRRYRELLDRFISSLVFHTSAGHWNGTPDWTYRPRIYEVGPFDPDELSALISELFAELFRGLPGKADATHWLDDTPYSFLHLVELRRVFPRVRCVHVYRDMRDVVASHQRAGWGGDDVVATARRVANVLNRWSAVRRVADPSTYLEVALEELVGDPDAVMDEICAFVGLEPSDELRAGFSQLDASRLHGDRWKRELPADRMDEIMAHLGPCLEAYGYG